MLNNYWQTRSIARLFCDSEATCIYSSLFTENGSNYTVTAK